MSVFRVRKKGWESVVLEAERRKKSSVLFSSQERTKARKLEGSVSCGGSRPGLTWVRRLSISSVGLFP